MTRVSICIPVYECVDTVARSVESALAQSFTDFECLVVDDGSTDGTADVVSAFDDDRIRLVRNGTNLGMVGNHNECIRLARGDLIQFVGGDDWLLPHCLERMVPAFDSPDVGLAFARRRIDTTDASWKARYGALDTRLQPLSAVNASRDMVRKYLASGGGGNPIGEPTNVMLRREMVVAAGGFPPEVPQLSDIDTWMRVLIRSDAAFVDDELSVRWHHSGSATDQYAGTTTLDTMWVLASIVRADRLGPVLRLRALSSWAKAFARLGKTTTEARGGRRVPRLRGVALNLRYLTTGRRLLQPKPYFAGAHPEPDFIAH